MKYWAVLFVLVVVLFSCTAKSQELVGKTATMYAGCSEEAAMAVMAAASQSEKLGDEVWNAARKDVSCIFVPRGFQAEVTEFLFSWHAANGTMWDMYVVKPVIGFPFDPVVMWYPR